MHDHLGGGTGVTRSPRRGFRTATAFGAVALLASALTAGGLSVAAGAQVRPHIPKFLACEVTDTGTIHDKSFNASAYAGLKDAVAADKGKVAITTQVKSSQVEADYAKNITLLHNAHCGLIVTVGFLMGNATWNAAKSYNTQHFAIVDQTDEDPNCFVEPCQHAPNHNIDGLTYLTNQDGFLGGYEAAATSKTHVVATYGGEQFGSVTIYMDGYVAGVRYYNAHLPKGGHKTKVLGWNPNTQTGTFIGSFTDETTAATDTTAFMSAGADVIFPVAGLDGLGTTSAVKTWNSSHSHHSLVEWVDTDGCVSDAADCSIFLTSVTKGVEASVKTAVLQAAGGHYKSGDYVGTLKNGGAALVANKKFNKLPAALASKIKSLTLQIETKKVSVDPTKYPNTTS